MDVYQTLQEKLNSYPLGAPARPELFEILRILFRPEEASLATHLTFTPQPIETIARLSGLPADEVRQICEGMLRKAIIFTHTKRGERHFGLLPVLPGLFEYNQMLPSIEGVDRERLRKLWQDYYDNAWAKEMYGYKTPTMRVLPVEQSIDAQSTALPRDRVSQVIENAELIAVANCACRMTRHKCDAPLETCMYFNTGAEYLVNVGAARMIDKAEAVAILHQSEEAGLVHTSANVSERVDVICNCCPCCCNMLKATLEHDLTPPGAAYVCEVAEADCIGCEACVDPCPVEAITMRDDLAVIDAKACIGCGLCVSECPTGAMTMLHRPDAPEPLRTVGEWAKHVAGEKGRLEQFMKNVRPPS